MSLETMPANMPTAHLVAMHLEPGGQYTAQVVGISDLRATAGSKEEALARIRQVLDEWLTKASWVRLQAASGEHPLQRFAGHSRDDPDFDGYLDEICRYRQEMDQQTCSSTSSTLTT